ncbi:MAG TPA: hypothetical protein VGH29_15275, partial [Candidatus Binataceae bacterium]
KGRGALRELTYPGVGTVSISRPPLRFSDAKTEITRPAPALGEHNREVLQELLGYSDAKIASLVEDGLLVGESATAGDR